MSQIAPFSNSSLTVQNSVICGGYIIRGTDIYVKFINVTLLSVLSFRPWEEHVEGNSTTEFDDVNLTKLPELVDYDPIIQVAVHRAVFRGDVSICDSTSIETWESATVVREYVLAVEDREGSPLKNVSLNLVNKHNDSVRYGTTSLEGVPTGFNLTFADGNFTEVLRLNAFEPRFYNETRVVKLLSSTPVSVVLTEKLESDLDENRQVNIVDISVVAKAFKARPRDENWNPIADLNKDSEINILDITLVAKDFGKTT